MKVPTRAVPKIAALLTHPSTKLPLGAGGEVLPGGVAAGGVVDGVGGVTGSGVGERGDGADSGD